MYQNTTQNILDAAPLDMKGGGAPFNCPGVEVVSREEWGARDPRKVVDLPQEALGLTFVHHSAMQYCYNKEECIKAVRAIQNLHMGPPRDWDDIGYSFLVGEDGRVYVGRGWLVQGAHTLGYNNVAHGICVMGDFTSRTPNQKALNTLQKLIQCGVKNNYTTHDYELFGHRDGRCTSCPGDAFYKLIQSWPHYSHRKIHRYCHPPQYYKDKLQEHSLLLPLNTKGGGAPFKCPEIEVVSREEWGAKDPRKVVYLPAEALGLTFIHHSEMQHCYNKEECIKAVTDIQTLHMGPSRGWDDIGYSFLVGEDGRVYVGRGWLVQGAHTLGYNNVAYGICVMGDFTSRTPNQKALNTLQKLIQCGIENNYITHDYELFGHRDGRCTSCPGDAFYKLIKSWSHYSHRKIHSYCHPPKQQHQHKNKQQDYL